MEEMTIDGITLVVGLILYAVNGYLSFRVGKKRGYNQLMKEVQEDLRATNEGLKNMFEHYVTYKEVQFLEVEKELTLDRTLH